MQLTRPGDMGPIVLYFCCVIDYHNCQTTRNILFLWSCGVDYYHSGLIGSADAAVGGRGSAGSPGVA